MFLAGIINLLDEPQDEIKCHAVRTLNSIVDFFWPEIADAHYKLYLLIVYYGVSRP